MEFKYWLESGESPSAAYQRIWAPHFDSLEPERQKHFASWFPQGQNRIYLPITLKEKDFGDTGKESEQVRNEVQKAFGTYFQIVDWKNGIAGDGRKNQWKIAKALEYVAKNNPQAIDIRDRYMRLRARLNPTNSLLIAVSQDAHDIATMSTGRGWESCNSLSLSSDYGEKQAMGHDYGLEYLKMDVVDRKDYRKFERTYITSAKHGITTPTKVANFRYEGDEDPYEAVDWLPQGTFQLADKRLIPAQDVDTIQTTERNKGYDFDKLAAEIVGGGLIAYLIYPEDKEIRSPLGRIMLRRYEHGQNKQSFLVCNDGVTYGVASDIMTNYLQKWLAKKQPKPGFGRYHKAGGGWISGDKYDIDIDVKKIHRGNEKQILQALTSEDWSYREAVVYKILKHIETQGIDSVSKNFWKTVKNVILKRENGDGIERKLRDILTKYPDAISFEELMSQSYRNVSNILADKSNSFSYSYHSGTSEPSRHDKFQEFAAERLAKLSNIKLPNMDKFKQAHKHTNRSKMMRERPELVSQTIKKATDIMGSKRYDDKDKQKLVDDITTDFSYLYSTNQTPEVYKEWFDLLNKMIARALPYLGYSDRRQIQSTIENGRKFGSEPNMQTLRWLEKQDSMFRT